MRTNISKKEAAIKLRKRGKSIRDIESDLGIAKSNLSGWLRDIELTKKQKEILHRKWLKALVKARKKANEFNRNQRLERIKKIKEEANNFVSNITFDKTMAELIFAAFYLAEGSKTGCKLEISNANPDILVGFWKLFRSLYPVEKSRVRGYLHLRLDQSEEKSKNYWSRVLNIPKSQFIKSQFDKRTISPTYKNYKGVCTVYYCDVGIQRRIIAIGEEFLQKMKTNKNMDG